MGAATNCSYTNSTGYAVQLLCDPAQCCSAHACAACDSSSGTSITQYLFWLILAGSAVFTVLVLAISYAVCRYRNPGCADASAAQDRFLQENILAATLGRARSTLHSSDSSTTATPTPVSLTPATASPHTGHSPSDSPELLVKKNRSLRRSMIPVKQATPLSVNRAFIMGAEAFSGKALVVHNAATAAAAAAGGPASAAVISASAATTSVTSMISITTTGVGAASAARAGVGVGGATRLVPNQHVLRLGAGGVGMGGGGGGGGDAGGAASPRMVTLGGLGGLSPRIKMKSKAVRTDSKQAMISSDAESMTTVGT